MSTPLFRPFFRPSLAPWIAAALALALPALGRAADSKEDTPPPGFSDKVSDSIAKLGPLLTAKNYDGALALLESLLPTVEADSYDQAAIENYLGGIWVQGKEQPEKAIQPWEKMLDIVSRHTNYFPANEVNPKYYYLATIYFQIAEDVKVKVDEATKRADLDKSLADMKHFLELTPKPTSEYLYFYATSLYLRATLNQEHPDKTFLAEAEKVAEQGLHSDIHPKDTFYNLLISADVTLGNLEQAADYMELLVKNKPNSKDWWPQLFSVYNNLAANNEKDDELYKKYLARDINTLERAQAQGFMKDPTNNYNLVTMYEQAGQYGIATDLLYKGLRSGAIVSDQAKWRNLALFYKLIGDDFSAIKVFKEADEKFPNTGDFDLQISDIYRDLENTQEAYNYSKLAVSKGHFSTQPYTAYYFLAFEAYELGKYQEALEACEKGLKYPNASKELANLRDAIKQVIANADAAKEAMKTQQATP